MPSRKNMTREEYNKYFREYRKRNLIKSRDYQREYNQLWRKKNGYHNEEKWKKNNVLKVMVQQLVQRAVERGEIKRKPCALCGNAKSVAHHPNYHKPLKVIFLCHVHHRQYHYAGRKKEIDVDNFVGEAKNNVNTGLFGGA